MTSPVTTGGVRPYKYHTIRWTATCATGATTGVVAPYYVAPPLTAYVSAGVASTQISGLQLMGVGDQNSTSGVVTLELTDVGGTRWVKIYKEAGKSTELATGSNVGNGTFVLAASAGQGVYGVVTVAYTGAEDSSVTVFGTGQVFIERMTIANDSGGTDDPVLFHVDYGATEQIYGAARDGGPPIVLELGGDSPGADTCVNITVTSANDGLHVMATGWQEKPIS